MSHIVFFGDSHTAAVRSALPKISLPSDVQVTVHQLTRIKNGQLIGTISHADAVLVCKQLTEADLVVSMIGGNQHSVLGLVQHPVPFDFFDAQGSFDSADGVTLIPRAAIKSFFDTGLRKNDCARIQALAAAGPHRTIHLAAPPPKADEAHILKRVETAFAVANIFEKGISPAPLRRKVWEMQCEVMSEILSEDGIDLLPPPPQTVTADGFLDPAFYARDATHANASYGLALLQQVLELAGVEPALDPSIC